jgi:hypothetical protein
MNKSLGQKVAEELINGKRTWILSGSFDLRQGFSMFPVETELVKLYLPDLPGKSPNISRTLTETEVRAMLGKPEYAHCTNQETVEFLLDEISKLRKTAQAKSHKDLQAEVHEMLTSPIFWISGLGAVVIVLLFAFAVAFAH